MSHGNIFLPPTPADKKTEKLIAGLNKIKLDDRLDLFEHPASKKLINLPHRHVFNNFDRFRHAVANTTDGPRILHTLIEFMKYDVRMAGKYTKWKNIEAKELRKIEEDVGRLKAKSQKLRKG